MAAPARVVALRALRLVATADLGDTLARTRDTLDDPRDRALATDLITGTLRWRGALDYQIERFSGRAVERLDVDLLNALRLGAYQLLHLHRVPPSAVVNDSVELVKSARLRSAAPLANAVLRRLSRERDALTWPPRDSLAEHLAVVHSHPLWLVSRWLARLGASTTEAWLRFNNEPPALTLAVNRNVATREAAAARLAAEGVRVEPTRIAPHGLRVLEGRPLSSGAYADGLCLLQDESSQIIPELVVAPAASRVLDACAAPGGKTVALGSQVGAGGLVVATDVRARRMRVLAATLARCRVTNARLVQVGSAAPWPFRSGTFDRVLIDAPCSGLGTVRRDPDIKWKRSPDGLPAFVQTQLTLLHRGAEAVRVGGRVVYSTCSSEPEENESVVQSFLASMPEFVLRSPATLGDIPAAIRTLTTMDGYLRTDPLRDGLEPFFAAVLERRSPAVTVVR
jgi:16S rRNA (cytosine967-C5)-methyltransferase